MTHLQYRRKRVKQYEAILDKWRRDVCNMPELVDDIRDLERHVNLIRGVAKDYHYPEQKKTA